MNKSVIRVLIIDDSALVRNILAKGLSLDPGIEVVGTAPDVFVARDKIVKLRPDVLTLDIEMPGMDGIAFLKKLMPQYPLPVIIVSSLTRKGKETTIQALEAGAIDFISKPTSNMKDSLQKTLVELATKIKLASTVNVSHWKKHAPAGPAPTTKSLALTETTDKIVAIGASTGGTEAIKTIVTALPRNFPGVVIVQHMPPGFTKMFAERLNQLSLLYVKEAEHGDRIMSGRVLIAPGDKHMKVVRSGGIYTVAIEDGPKVSGHRPSVDILFHSVAVHVAKNALGIILTGMGKDGAEGMLAMKNAGAFNIAQNEQTCIVYGMPKVASDVGAVDKILPLESIVQAAVQVLRKPNEKAG